MLFNGGVHSGWTFYVPLSISNLSCIDFMIFALHLTGFSSLLGSINFIATILSLNSSYSLSLYPLSIFFTSILLVIAVPVLAGVITMVLFDRHFNTSFFDPVRGGDCLLFQHLFWFFGHPEVYILILPAFGIISESLSRTSNSIIFGRDSMIMAMAMIVILGCIV
jgi:heme/copper-type cytochrome/quinol oxidase subunit 1